jgi:hypothetical protein
VSILGVGSGRSAEHLRLAEDARGERTWKQWGPYLSGRQWGTVREDYSPHGNAWEYLPHDMARSRAYRGERMASPASAMTVSRSAAKRYDSVSRCSPSSASGMGPSLSSRSACSQSPSSSLG